LREKEWRYPEDVELSSWWEAIQNEQIPTNSVFFPEKTNVRRIFLRLSHVRHHAVHRVRTPVDVLKRMMADTLLLVGGLGDGLRRNKLQKMERALHKDDMNSLKSVIRMPLDRLEMINVSQVPSQASRLAPTIRSHNMTTMVLLSWPPPKARPPPARAPSAPPTAPARALFARDPGPRPPRRHSAAENMPPRRPRSKSPLLILARSYRVRDDPARVPSMGTSNNRRFTGNFVDLTADSDDEANTIVPKAAYTRRQSPSNFVDLTMDD
jgi:hypothetical protein